MMEELKPDEFERARSLFGGFDYSLSIIAAIEGNNPGRIFVDKTNDPQTGFALTVEGYLLAGDDSNQEINDALSRLFSEKIFKGEIYVNGDWSMSLAVHPESWAAKLPVLIPTHELEKVRRYHYLCKALKFDWRGNLPGGYHVRQVDRSLLNGEGVVFTSPVREWMDIEEMWWTEENYLSKGISFVVVFDDQVVAWCTPDCVAGDKIDIGIYTHPDHRRRGLASVAVAATVEHCLNNGFSAVGWHCNADNIGSWKTAEKVDFVRNREYTYYYYIYDPVDHLAELGWYYYRRGEYSKTLEYYDQVFALRDENPDYYYHLVASAWALLKNREKALVFLKAAADRGWSQADWTKQQVEFNILQDMPEWNAVLAMMETASRGER
jgi:RimJ/RimL family protein N-acetyltransferase